MKGHQQPTGRAQSLLSSAFPIIILWIISRAQSKGVCSMGTVPKWFTWRAAKVCGRLRCPSALAKSLHGLEDCVHWLFAPGNFIAGGDRATI